MSPQIFNLNFAGSLGNRVKDEVSGTGLDMENFTRYDEAVSKNFWIWVGDMFSKLFP
jgi:hypothetical protein